MFCGPVRNWEIFKLALEIIPFCSVWKEVWSIPGRTSLVGHSVILRTAVLIRRQWRLFVKLCWTIKEFQDPFCMHYEHEPTRSACSLHRRNNKWIHFSRSMSPFLQLWRKRHPTDSWLYTPAPMWPRCGLAKLKRPLPNSTMTSYFDETYPLLRLFGYCEYFAKTK